MMIKGLNLIIAWVDVDGKELWRKDVHVLFDKGNRQIMETNSKTGID
jgi:hypothetical protein